MKQSIVPRPSFVPRPEEKRTQFPPVPFVVRSRRSAVARTGLEAQLLGTAVRVEEEARAIRRDGRIVQAVNEEDRHLQAANGAEERVIWSHPIWAWRCESPWFPLAGINQRIWGIPLAKRAGKLFSRRWRLTMILTEFRIFLGDPAGATPWAVSVLRISRRFGPFSNQIVAVDGRERDAGAGKTR